MPVSIRPAGAADIPLIHHLADKIWRVHYTPMIGEAQVNYMLAKMYSPESLAGQMEAGDHFFIAELDGRPLGYISISKKAEGDYFLNKFYLDQSEQGKGYGKQVFAQALALFPELKTLRLQVNRMNYKTINFYFRLGFTIETAKDFDIGDGFSMDDFVMLYKRSA